jgi:hypothetical protein
MSAAGCGNADARDVRDPRRGRGARPGRGAGRVPRGADHAASRGAALLLAAALALAACERDAPPADPAAEPAATPAASAPPVAWEGTAEDSVIFVETMRWAREQGLGAQPIGEIVAQVARRFVGAPYVPNTLEAEGDERLVVNLRTFDCVTLVESVLAMARLLRDGRDEYAAFLAELQRIRYRDGALDGYISRLHYFSDWIADNERRGIVRDVTGSIGGVPDPEPIDFMSRHAGSYRQLSDPDVLRSVRAMEARISARDRWVIPQARIGELAEAIRNGDVIAATSSIAGLDVAHTGFAYWQDGRLHLLHAPLIGTVVEISERPLAERILRIGTQDGIMVARPQ